ncbi:GDSL-type esterase/lipase family protein [Catenovulum sp. 2E275]|uniref:GDSL-type esterase/lipase family protein n=1 Tax=Catenovulum sp. 2E275 TaxID=2980497 RepID=UPI0021D262E2|nr:GDSL-type esterase/lipase family protein [Catenovulum sp. 2E275]MCU4677246.1 GDSL-type esterase/lipase family protein [Catenovulum sp. 2E275]
MNKLAKILCLPGLSLVLLACNSTNDDNEKISLKLSTDKTLTHGFKLKNHQRTVDLVNAKAEFVSEIESGKAQFTKAQIVADNTATLSFQNSWHSALIWDYSQNPLNLTQFTEKGILSVDLKADNADKSALNLVLSCGESCTGKVRLREWVQQNTGKGWQTLKIPLSCFEQPNADYSKLDQPLILEGDGSADIQIKNVTIHANGAANFECANPSDLSTTPAVLNEYWSVEWWMPRHEQKLLQAKTQNPDFILIGDSITHGWEDAGKDVWNKWFADIHTLNLGFSGDRTENVLWRLQHGEVDGLSPKLVMIMIGTNNTGHRMENPEFIINGINAILTELDKRIPNSKVLLLNIFPRGAEISDEARQNNIKVNQLLDDVALKHNALRADFNADFLDESGHLSKAIMPDLLHPNEQGYEIWAKQLNPFIDQYIRQLEQ